MSEGITSIKAPWLHVFAGRCQVLAGRALCEPAEVLFATFSHAFAEIPARVSVPEQLLLRGLVTQFLARMLSAGPITDRENVSVGFLQLASSSLVTSAWRLDVLRFIDLCIDAVLQRDRPSIDCSGSIREVLRVLDNRYREPNLTLGALHHQVPLSVWHISRLLKKETGQSFLAHVHERRIAAAHALLTTSTFTIKEIAAVVGYTSVTQLDRHYKRRHGVTPRFVRTASLRITVQRSPQELSIVRKN